MRARRSVSALAVHVVAERHRHARPCRGSGRAGLEALDVDRLGQAHDLGDGCGERADPPLDAVVEDDDGRDEVRELRWELQVEDVAVRDEDLRRQRIARGQLAGDGAVLDEQHVGRRREARPVADGDAHPEPLGASLDAPGSRACSQTSCRAAGGGRRP